MKVLIPILIGLLVVGCGKDKQTTSGQPVSQNETVIEADAESASHSLYGLEEWGNDGVKITIHYLPEDNSFNPFAIETQIGLKLRQAGITVKEKNPSSEINHELTYRNGNGFLYIIIRPVRVSDRVVAYSVIIFPRRQATYEANGKKYHRLMGPKWVYSGIAPAGELGESINKYMDKFLLDYLKANNNKKGPNYFQRPPKRITENSLEDDIAGTYVNGKTKLVFYKDGSVEQFYKGASRKWKWKVTSVENKEIVAFASYFKRMSDGNLLDVALDLGNGRREVYPKEKQKVYRKIK
jgi:hypothetical protein